MGAGAVTVPAYITNTVDDHRHIPAGGCGPIAHLTQSVVERAYDHVLARHIACPRTGSCATTVFEK